MISFKTTVIGSAISISRHLVELRDLNNSVGGLDWEELTSHISGELMRNAVRNPTARPRCSCLGSRFRAHCAPD